MRVSIAWERCSGETNENVMLIFQQGYQDSIAALLAFITMNQVEDYDS